MSVDGISEENDHSYYQLETNGKENEGYPNGHRQVRFGATDCDIKPIPELLEEEPLIPYHLFSDPAGT